MAARTKPESTVTNAHSFIRALANTPAGRAQLGQWAGKTATTQQSAFEQAGDFANDRLFALHQAAPRNPHKFGSLEWRQFNDHQSEAAHKALIAELEAL